jgi:long-chain acyl-CoA synthetase
MEVSRIFDIPQQIANDFPGKEDVFLAKENGKWKRYSIDYYIENINLISLALLNCGFGKGDKIATICNNRPEWNFIDMGIAQIGAVHVTIYPTLNPAEIHHIISHSESRLVFISDFELIRQLEPIFEFSEVKPEFIQLPANGNSNSWNSFTDKGKSFDISLKERLVKLKSEVKDNDPLCLIYTSGTTGQSKGVMLSHKNLLSTAQCSNVRHVLTTGDSCISILPLSHVFEHMVSYMHQMRGISIIYAESTSTFASDLIENKANGFVAVPRLVEKIFEKLQARGRDLPKLKKRIFFWAVHLGFRFEFNHQNGLWYRLQHLLADKLIFSKWRKAFGGQIKFIGCGGAALQPRLERLFWAAGMPVYVGYGLTETSPIISVNYGQWPDIQIGTVGRILEICQVKINPDGEILVKGENLMLGYYKDEELTNKEIDTEGWFHTGDIGELDASNFLSITDRKKEMFKTSGGKYIPPQVIENMMKESSFVEQVMVVGENQKFPAALLVPNFPFLHDWCSIHKLKFRDNADLVQMPEVISRFQREIDSLNTRLSRFEKIKAFCLIAEEWTTQTGELSPTLKLKRKVLEDKYKAQINQLFLK